MKQIPAEIQAALSALETLKQQDEAAPHEALAKILPGVARQLHLAGEAVTPEILIAHAKQGLDHLKQLSTKQPQKRNYQDIVKRFRPECPDTDSVEDYDNLILYLALKESLAAGGEISAEHHRLSYLSAQLNDLEMAQRFIRNGMDNDNLSKMIGSAAKQGHLEMAQFLIESGANIHRALIDAALNGQLEMVKLLIKNGADITTERHLAIICAASIGHIEIAKILIENGADITAQQNEALTFAAQNGHPKMVKFLIKNGADVTAKDNNALFRAISYGQSEMVKFLIENGADIHARDDAALIHAVGKNDIKSVKFLLKNGANIHAHKNSALLILASQSGHLEMVKFLLKKGMDITAQNNEALVLSSLNGHLETVKFLIENGADVTANDNSPLLEAARLGQSEIVKFLIENGADITLLNEETRKKLDSLDIWKKMFPTLKNTTALLDATPHFFKQDCYEAVLPMLEQEGYTGKEAQIYSYHISGLLRSEDRVLQYLEKWGKLGKQPLHNIIHMIRLPQSGQPDLKAWGDAILQHGPKLGRYLKFADKLPRPERGEGDRGYSYVKTKEKIAEFSFSNGHLNPQLASFCLDHGWDQRNFDSALKQIQKYQEKYSANDNRKAEDRIPNISLDGDSFDKPGYRFYKLPDGDIRGLLLGEFTDCCQHLASAGAACSKHGFLSENGGFYVVADKKTDQIVAQSWAWRGQSNELVLDSFEYLSGHFNKAQAQSLCEAFGAAVQRQQKTDISRVLLGKGGNTPRLSLVSTDILAKPVDYDGYRDSKKAQCLIATLQENPNPAP